MILPRQINYNCGYSNSIYNDHCYYNSPFNTWGRWVVLAVIVVVVLILLFVLSCFSSRRRRRRGLHPYYGTGWLAAKQGTPQGYQQPYQGGQQGYQGGQPGYQGGQSGYQGSGGPGYGVAPNNTYYGAPAGGAREGYDGQEHGIELANPPNAYVPAKGGDPVYQAPSGPPPGKDGFIR